MLLPFGSTAAQDAADQTEEAPSNSRATDLDRVIVTGSLLPQTELETFKPVTVITAEDIQTRGFTSVADVLQRASMATGGVQGNQTSASFTQGAETNSLFGLNPGYTKYLLNGRPMANYPALYNGSDVFNNISNIPVDLVERIEILPGGQSSLYGSDAIAGVINIILKKRMDGSVVSARVGDYSDGGGASWRASFATGVTSKDERLNILTGVQFEKIQPIWARDRDLTKQINTNAYGDAAPIATRDFLITSPFTSYKFLDPANCANVSSAFDGTEGLQTRPGFGDEQYCGSFRTPGYRTLKNEKDAAQIYTNATYDLDDNTRLYGDFLYSNETTRYHSGSGYTWWGTSADYGYFYDPRIGRGIADAYGMLFCGDDQACIDALPGGDLLNLQRAFAPEDMGGWRNSMNYDVSEAYSISFGAQGTFGSSNWDYDVGFSRTHYELTENGWNRFREPMDAYFREHVLGPQLGLDPYFNAYPVFEPDYAAFYQLIAPEDFNRMTGHTRSRSETYDNMYRAQVTNASLFGLPGGDAGLALAVEGGNQGWSYTPDARLIPDPVTLQSEVWGTTSIAGSGSRTRYAATGELRLPLFDPLTITVSGRYDSFSAGGERISKPTYSVGFEYRPFESLLFRGKYGTAFKAPSLADQFQGLSGFYSSTTDYLSCNQAGFDPTNIADCPDAISNVQYFGQQEGNVNLDPINAKVWSYGVVWAPSTRFSIGADYHHWDIEDEVAQQSVDSLMLDELRCTSVDEGGTGELDPASGTCQAALSQITRGVTGDIQSIYVTKVNVANEVLNAVTVDLHYLQPLGRFGDLSVNASATHNIRHDQQTYPTDPVLDLLDPFYSQDPKTKANASLAWSIGDWTTTVFADYMSGTPNNRLWLLNHESANGTVNDDTHMLGSYITYNASVNWDATPTLRLSLLANNVLNEYPDMDDTYDNLTGSPYTSSQYNAYGRSIYFEARWSFGASGR
jgi:outer membrane receptor protein involved in Fe transport